MAAPILEFAYPSDGFPDNTYTVSGFVDSSESYRTTALAEGVCHAKDSSDDRTYDSTITSVTMQNPGARSAMYVFEYSDGRVILNGSNGYNSVGFEFQVIDSNLGTLTETFGGLPYKTFSYEYTVDFSAQYVLNIPIFENSEDAEEYSNPNTTDTRALELLATALNYYDEPLEEKIYEFSTIARNYTMDGFGNLTENESEGERYRGLRIKINGLAALYKIPGISDGNLKYGIKLSDTPIICYYSTDYGNTWQNVPGQPTTLPFDFIWRPYETDDGEGTFWAAVGDGDNKNLFIFDNEEDATEYTSGGSDGRKASNYGKITNEDPNNPTGEDSEETEFGNVYTQGFFSQQYIMSTGALSALANDLYDTSAGGIWEDIKKGLDMYGANPMDAVMGLSFFPLDLTSVYSSTPATHVWFGGYGWEPTGGTCNRVIAPNGYKTLGSITIRRTFRNWRDYSPYTRLYVSLPYCGVYELDLNRYYDKTVEVRYFFDTRTNGCIACLIADGHLMDYYNGQIGVTMPITLTDFSNYANSQIQTLLGFGGQAANTGLNAMAAAPQVAAAGTGAAALGIAGAGVAGAAIGAKAVYGLSMNNINKFNVTKGGSSSMINEYLPQYVEFTFEIQEDCAPDNYGQLYGYPSMMSGSVGSFSGFLKCQSVKLNCANATEAERNEIKQLLMSGIYI